MINLIYNKLKSPTYSIKKPGYHNKLFVIITYKVVTLTMLVIFLIISISLKYDQMTVSNERVYDILSMIDDCDYKSSEPSVFVKNNPENLLNNSLYIESLSTLKECVVYRDPKIDYFIGKNKISPIKMIVKEVCTDYKGTRKIMLNIVTQSDDSICFKGDFEMWFDPEVSCVNKSSKLIYNGVRNITEPLIDLSFWNDKTLRCYRNVDWSFWSKASILFGLFSMVNIVLILIIKNIRFFHIKIVGVDGGLMEEGTMYVEMNDKTENN